MLLCLFDMCVMCCSSSESIVHLSVLCKVDHFLLNILFGVLEEQWAFLLQNFICWLYLQVSAIWVKNGGIIQNFQLGNNVCIYCTHALMLIRLYGLTLVLVNCYFEGVSILHIRQLCWILGFFFFFLLFCSGGLLIVPFSPSFLINFCFDKKVTLIFVEN